MFQLTTDASGRAIGAVLANSNKRPIAYASRALNKAELNYSTIKKELLAIVWAVKHFRPYLFGRRFIVHTDHRPLKYLFALTEPSSRLTKFRLTLEEYQFEVEYIKGQEAFERELCYNLNLVKLGEIRIKFGYKNTVWIYCLRSAVRIIWIVRKRKNRKEEDCV